MTLAPVARQAGIVVLVLLGTMAMGPAPASEIGFPWEPLPPCAGEAAAVPPYAGAEFVPYRKKLLAAGWQPAAIRDAEGTLPESYNMPLEGRQIYAEAEQFWKRGIREVEFCAGIGLNPCYFKYVDAGGNPLTVMTLGEQFGPGNDVDVERVELGCTPSTETKSRR